MIVSGEVIRSRGSSTSEFTPGYVKPKHEVNPQMTLRRLPDEDPQNLADPAYRRRRIILQNMRDEEERWPLLRFEDAGRFCRVRANIP